MFTELHIFDFDGTLFKSPTNTPENHKIFEDATGIPWVINKQKSAELTEQLGRPISTRSGWWGRAETLEPPLVPNPAPPDWFNQRVVADFHASKANPNAQTCLMTGRHKGLKNHVLRICHDGNLFSEHDDVSCFFLGELGPDPQGDMPNDTLGWKLWIIRQLMRTNPQLSKIIFWEDREEHVQPFLDINGEESVREVIVHRIYL